MTACTRWWDMRDNVSTHPRTPRTNAQIPALLGQMSHGLGSASILSLTPTLATMGGVEGVGRAETARRVAEAEAARNGGVEFVTATPEIVRYPRCQAVSAAVIRWLAPFGCRRAPHVYVWWGGREGARADGAGVPGFGALSVARVGDVVDAVASLVEGGEVGTLARWQCMCARSLTRERGFGCVPICMYS